MSQPPAPRRKRILLVTMHPGYVRNYEEPIRLLLDDGHDVHVAVAAPAKRDADRIAERMANDHLNLTVSRLPKPARPSAADNLRRALRGLADYARYQHPRFADASALRARARSKLLKRRAGMLPIAAITLYVPTLGRIRSAAYADAVAGWALRMANALPAPADATRWLRGLEPDVFLTTPHVAIGTNDPEFLDAARGLGIPSAILVASWDNLTNKGLVKSPADRVVVWNEAQRAEAVELHGVPAERVTITGAQRFDDWFEMSASGSRESFAARVGLDPDKPYVLYLCSSPFIAPDEVPFVRRFAQALRSSGGPLADAGLLIRPHPQNARQWADVDAGELGNAVIWPRAGEQPVHEAAKQGFYDSMCHSLAVVGINTSAQIEAGIVGRTVHTVRDPAFADAHEGTLHFRHLLVENGGLLYVADDLPALVRNLEAVHGSELRDDHTERFVERFIRPLGIDRPASPIVAGAIGELLDGPSRTSVALAPLRARQRGLLSAMRVLSWSPGRVSLRRRARAIRAAIGARVFDSGIWLPERLRARDLRDHAPPVRRESLDLGGLVVFEPWEGDRAGELLYWIPMLRAVRRSLAAHARVIVVTAGSDPRWYATLDYEAVRDVAELDLPTWDRAGFARILADGGEAETPSFHGPADGCADVLERMRRGELAWRDFAEVIDTRALMLRAPGGAADGDAAGGGMRAQLGHDVLAAAEAGEPLTLVGGAAGALREVDARDPVSITTALDAGSATITTDLGTAALAVSMRVATTFVRTARAGDESDLDLLDRTAGALDVRLEILDAAALRALLVGARTVAG